MLIMVGFLGHGRTGAVQNVDSKLLQRCSGSYPRYLTLTFFIIDFIFDYLINYYLSGLCSGQTIYLFIEKISSFLPVLPLSNDLQMNICERSYI